MADQDSSDLGAQARLEAAFAREERRGLMVAAAARSAAVAVIIGWLAIANPDTGLAYAWTLGTACVLLVTGLAQFWLYWRQLASPIVSYAFMLVDSLVLAAAVLLPNPFDTMNLPPAMPLRYASFMYFFVLLMQAAFSFRPRLLLWTGLSGAAAWTLGFLWIVTRPETIVASGGARQLAVYFDRNFASVIKFENEIIVFLLVSAGLALLVRRSRALVAERADAERARGNLARYFCASGSACTTVRWWRATLAAAGAWPTRPWVTPPTSPAACGPSPAKCARTSWPAARSSPPSDAKAPTRSYSRD